MEDFLLAVLIIAAVWLIARQSQLSSSSSKIDELTDHIARLERRLGRLEATAAPPQPTPTPEPAPQPVAPPKTFVVAPPPLRYQTLPPRSELNLSSAQTLAPPPPPQAAPRYVPPPPTTPTRSISLEERLGQNWLNKLGIVTLVIGLALFLGYQLRTLGPLGKSLIGFALAFILLIGGLFLERRPNYRIFARAAIGGGWALTFFVTFALYHLTAMQVLHSQAVDLTLMFLVASAMVAHSLHYKSQVVTGLAFLLAFVTVGISDVTLFSLVAGAVLAAGLIVIAFRQTWFWLTLAGLFGVYINHFLWLHRVIPEGGQAGHPFPGFYASAGLLLLYWLLFRLFYIFRKPGSRDQELISSFTAILNSIGLMSLLKFQSAHPEWAFFALLALGVVELALAFIAVRQWRGAFVVLSSIGSVLLLAAIPFHFGGSHWSVLWLFEAEVLFIAGLRLREIVFRRLGLLALLAAAGQIFVVSAIPIFNLRQSFPDPSHHLPVTIALLSAAALLWLNAEFLTRRAPFLAAEDLDRAALVLTSYLGAIALWVAIWVGTPSAWVVVLWMLAVLALGGVADKLSSTDLATQSDLIAASVLARLFLINLPLAEHWGAFSLRAITFTLVAALLYLSMHRKTRAYDLAVDYIPTVYSWAATILLAILLWYELQSIGIAVAWGIFALILFELGMVFRRTYLRHQAYALLAASFVRIFFANLDVEQGTHTLSPRLYTVIPLVAAYVWVYERIHREENREGVEDQITTLDRRAAQAFSWAGIVAAAALLYFEVRPEWVAITWAVLAFLLIGLAVFLKRPIFTAQSLALLLASAFRAVMFSLFSPTPLTTTFTASRSFCVGATCAVMFLTLPAAFRIREQYRVAKSDIPVDSLTLMLSRPEQPFFFVPLLLLTVLLAVQLRAGMITVSWSALGVLVFLFALTVKERSYRLAGLSLLLLGVGKILCIDIWNASPSDRYITLIVMGAALLLVSFLYSRYRETLLKLL